MVTMATGSVVPTSPVQLMGSVDFRVAGLAEGRWPNWFGFSENKGLDDGVPACGVPDVWDVTVGGVLLQAASSTAPIIAHAVRTGRECFEDAHRAREGANWKSEHRP